MTRLAELLNKLIAEAPPENEGAVQVQVQVGSVMHAGAVRHSPDHKGLYEMVSMVPTRDQKLVAISVYFSGDALTALCVARGVQEKLIETPPRGLIIPGAQ